MYIGVNSNHTLCLPKIFRPTQNGVLVNRSSVKGNWLASWLIGPFADQHSAAQPAYNVKKRDQNSIKPTPCSKVVVVGVRRRQSLQGVSSYSQQGPEGSPQSTSVLASNALQVSVYCCLDAGAAGEAGDAEVAVSGPVDEADNGSEEPQDGASEVDPDSVLHAHNEAIALRILLNEHLQKRHVSYCYLKRKASHLRQRRRQKAKCRE